MFKSKELIIFDMDGTLIDSAPSLIYAINYTLQKLGLEQIDYEVGKSYIGKGSEILIKRALVKDINYQNHHIDSKLFKEAHRVFLEFYGANLNAKTTLYEGVLETLDALKKHKLKLALATNKPHQFVKDMLKYFQIDGYFDIFLGAGVVANKKPHPDILLECIKRVASTKDRAVMVGDSSNDIQAANRANIDSIFVTYGYCTNSDAIKADLKVDKINQIVKYLI
jgi:phosphoglycolate phosphatase